MTAGGGAFATRAWQQVRGPASVVFLAACGCAPRATPPVTPAAPAAVAAAPAAPLRAAPALDASGALTRFALGINEGLAVPARQRADLGRDALAARLAQDAQDVRGLGASLVRGHTFNFPPVSCSALARNPAALDDMDAWVVGLGADLEGVGMVSPWPGNQSATFTDQYVPADLAAFRTCVTRLVERYDGDGVEDMPGLVRPIRFWEVDNEPDLKNSNVSRTATRDYDPRRFCTPAEYAAVLVEASAAIRSANPSATVLALGLFRPHADQGQAYAREVLATPGALAAFDILSLHTYHDDDGERLAAGVRAVAALAPGKRIWVTETSVTNAGGEEEQARRVAALVARAAEAGAEALFWHTLADPPPRAGGKPAGGGGHFSTNSLLQGQERGPAVDKPAAAVFRRLAEQLGGDDLRGAVPDGTGGTRLRSGALLLWRGSRPAEHGAIDLRTGALVAPGATATAPAWLQPAPP